MALTLVLAKNITEANRYARAVGLPRFSYRAVRNAAAIRGVRAAEVHLLSSFLDRLDRHAIMAALRTARYLEVFYVDFRDGEIVDSENDLLFGIDNDDVEPGHNDPIPDEVLEAAYAEHFEREGNRLSALVSTDEETSGQTGEAEPSEDPAPTEEPKKNRRRTRCKDCGELHFKGECKLVAPAPSVDPADFFAN